MKKVTWLLRLVGMIQIVLGLFYLLAPDFILIQMGHSQPPADIHYPLVMLASRFIAFGVVLLYIAPSAAQHRLWLQALVLIQLIDLAGGIFYTANNTVPLALSAFPMFNASWIIVLTLLWMPRRTETA